MRVVLLFENPYPAMISGLNCEVSICRQAQCQEGLTFVMPAFVMDCAITNTATHQYFGSARASLI
jgi:hypothetical protein